MKKSPGETELLRRHAEAQVRAARFADLMLERHDSYEQCVRPISPSEQRAYDPWHALGTVISFATQDVGEIKSALDRIFPPNHWRNVVVIQTPAHPNPLGLQFAVLRRNFTGMFEVSEARLLGRTAQERPELQPMHALAGGYQRGITVTLEPQAKLRVAVPSSVGRIVPHFYLRWWAVCDQPDNDTEAECDIDFGDCVEMTGTIEVSATLPFIPNARFACAIEDKKG